MVTGQALQRSLAPPPRPSRGFPSGWRRYQALLALALCRDGRMGRERLCQALGASLGATRNLVVTLRQRGLVVMDARGVGLTSAGQDLLAGLGLIHGPVAVGDLTVGVADHALCLTGHARQVGSGLRQRDVALLAGALGATTLVSDRGHWRLPDGNPIADGLAQELSVFPHQDGDVLAIGTADEPLAARRGAFAVGTDLLVGGVDLR